MNSVDIEVLRTALAWTTDGHRVVLGTVLRTWGSAPRPPGSMMVVRDDGQVAGSVSGGCVEDDLVRRLQRGELAATRPELTRYGGDAEEARRFMLPCGGTIEIVLEPLGEASRLPELLAGIEARGCVERQLDIVSGEVSLHPGRPSAGTDFDGRVLRTVLGPKCRLLIIGANPLARYLAAMAVMLDYLVTVCEPRQEYHQAWAPLEGVLLSDEMPDELTEAMQLDANSALVAVTHAPALDDLALIEALKTPAFYVGVVGSRRNHEQRRERLREFDLGRAELERLRGPAGLNLGALTPSEIALAILAEMTALRHGRELDASLADWRSSTRNCQVGAALR